MRDLHRHDETIRNKKADGEAIETIAGELAWSVSTVKRRLRSMGLTVEPSRYWTPARDQQLRDLRGLGYSYGRCALIIGAGATRSACIGRADRLHIPRIVKVPKPEPKKQSRKAGPVALAPVPYSEPPARPGFLGVTFDQLGAHHCRYPRGEGGAMLFCGQPQMEGSSYCPACHAATHRAVSITPQQAEAELDIARRLAEAQARAA